MDMNYLASLQKLAETSGVITFDVFDTCIHRSVARPVHVFDLVARKWCADDPTGLPLLNRFRVERMRAEAAARKTHRHREDITFDNIYEHLGQALALSEAQLNALAELELRIELEVCYPNPIIKAFYDACVARGAVIAFISDMYLPAAQIGRMLAKCGFDPQNLFVSSEVGVCKGSGKLFAHALRQLAVKDPASVLHVGDNEQADVRAARKAGLNAFHFDYLHKMDADIASRSGFVASDDASFANAASFGLLRRRQIENSISTAKRHLGDVGYEIFGPALSGWFLWLTRRVAEIAPKKILLFARDAQLVNRLVAEGALCFGGVEIEYVYVSRHALSFASIRVLDDHLLGILLRRFQGETIRHFLGLWCELSPDRLKEIGFPPGLDPDEKISKDLHPALMRFIYENQSAFLSAAREHRDRASLYLGRNLKDESTVIIDVGWTGSMQPAWRNTVATSISVDQVDGLYFGLLPDAQATIKRGHRMEGWYWQPHKPREAFDMLGSGGIELLELALSADHGTTLGYAADGSPILAQTAEDSAYQECCLKIQAGIKAFWSDLRALCPERELRLQPCSADEWTQPLSRLVLNPLPEEVELLGDIRHAVEGGRSKPFALAPKICDPEAKPERVIWRHGFAARNGLISIF